VKNTDSEVNTKEPSENHQEGLNASEVEPMSCDSKANDDPSDDEVVIEKDESSSACKDEVSVVEDDEDDDVLPIDAPVGNRSSEMTIVDVNDLLARAPADVQKKRPDEEAGKPLNLTKKSRPMPQLNEIRFPGTVQTPPKSTTPTPPLLKVNRAQQQQQPPAPTPPKLDFSNSILLDGYELSDDSDVVVEAASFVTPYLYQKMSKEKLLSMWRRARKEVLAANEETKDAVDEIEEMFEEFEKEEKEEAEEAEKEKSPEKAKKSPEKAKTTKKKRNKAKDDDEWTADGEDEPDSSDSDAEVVEKKEEKPSDPYFSQPIGSFLLDLGTDLVQEFVSYDQLRIQKRRLEKEGGPAAPAAAHEVIRVMTEKWEKAKAKNAPYKLSSKRCGFCNFRSVTFGSAIRTL
jgi:hypothetical protein